MMTPNRTDFRSSAARRGFTIPEYMVTVALVVIVGAGMLGACLFAGRLYALTQTKLDTNEDVRSMLADFAHEIRAAQDFDIGQGNETNFFPVAADTARKGNAIQIYLSTDTNDYVRYFLDTNSQKLKFVAADVKGVFLVAHAVTNLVPFSCEDIWGNITTNEQPSEIVALKLQLNPTVIKTTTNSSAHVKDYFELNTRVNKRTLLGFQSL